MLRRAKSTKASPATIRAIIASGCPTNPDGTIDFVKFVAFLATKEDGESTK